MQIIHLNEVSVFSEISEYSLVVFNQSLSSVMYLCGNNCLSLVQGTIKEMYCVMFKSGFVK